ncbi:hypothetical protein GCM10020370_67950 [Paenibacillus hodogayensis]
MKNRAKQHTLKARATVLEAVVSQGEGNETIQGSGALRSCRFGNPLSTGT